MKNSFVFYTEWIEQIRILEEKGTPEDREAFWSSLQAQVEGGDLPDTTTMAQVVLIPIRNQIARDTAKYEETSRKNSENGKKGAAAKKAKREEATASEDKRPQAKTSIDDDEDDDVDVSTNVDVVGSEVILTFPLAKGKEFSVTPEIFNMLAECYPNVDTMEQLRKLKAWAISNPKRRKVDGMKFLNNWFSWEQDKGPPVTRSGPTKTKDLTAEELFNLPAIIPWTEVST